MRISRRQILLSGAAAAAGVAFAGCDRLSAAPTFREFLASAEGVNQAVQRALLWRGALAREYSVADLSAVFRANGSQDFSSLPPEYPEIARNGFADWRLEVDGLVNRRGSFALGDLRRLPARTQITRHDCVEGWSCIGGWTGTPLANILDSVGLHPEARFIVFHCADELPRYVDGTKPFYESIDLVDAFHPQTILAYDMNGAPLPLAHGAPVRLRLERQLGYKMAKFVSRIEAVARLDGIRQGRGGTWEDDGYEWYAGI